MKQTLAEWDDDKLDDFEPEVQEMIEGMLSVFQTTVEKKRDIISFYY